MHTESVPLKHSDGTGIVIPAGPVNLVLVIAAHGMVGCGAFDIEALGKHRYPAARVRPTRGPSIESVADLLAAEVKDVNEAARSLGIRPGMSGKDALDLLSLE